MKIKHIKIILLSYTMLSCFMIMTGLWAIDIGASGMSLEAKYGTSFKAMNGLFSREPILQYHMGLWLVGISSFMLSIIVIIVIMNWKEKEV